MRRWLYLGLIAVLGLTILLSIDTYYRNQIAEENGKKLSTTTTNTQREIENAVQIRLIAVEDLQAFMLASENLPSFTTFDQFAKELLNHYPTVRTVQFINTDLIIEHTYPLAGNEAAIGLDLSDHPTTSVALKAIEERTLAVTNPIVTAQGSLALIARLPLYHDDELLGLVAGVFDIDAILKEIVNDLDNEFALCLADATGHLFWGDANLKTTSQSTSIAVADQTWRLTVGWQGEAPQPSQFTLGLIWLGGLPFLLSLMFLTNQAFTRYDWLNKSVAEKTRELEMKNQQLEREVAERKLAERELQLSHEILKQLPSAIILANTDGVIQRWMGRAQEIFGYTETEAIGQSINIIRLPSLQDEYTELIVKTVYETGKFIAEKPYRRKDGTIVPIETNISALHDEDGHSIALIAVIKDITERKQTEQLREEHAQLELQLEKEKELVQFRSQLISIIAHEFRTPLTIILTSSTLLVDYEDKLTPEKRRKRIRNIVEQAERLGKMLDDIDILTKSQRGFLQYDPKLMNIVSFCENLVDELTHIIHVNQKLVFESHGSFSLMSLDPELMRHALTNLVSNAIKYSEDGGTISLELTREDKHLIIKVRDQGIGIPPEDGEHLFEPFHRAHNVGSIRGTGLGLSIVKDIVELHGGKITFESKPNIGTVFIIKIPLRDSPPLPQDISNLTGDISIDHS